jgi:murein DD-endopeptidase MepM/ murein hydrolase activator NlpD
MTAPLCRSLLAAVVVGGLLLGDSSVPPSRAGSASALAARPQPSEWGAGSGDEWLAATRAVLDDPTEVNVPFTAPGELSADAAAAAFAFDALGGQTLEITLERGSGTGADTPIYVEVFRVVDVLGQALRQRLTALPPGEASLKTRLPRDGSYHVLVQASAAGARRYTLTLELAAALPFPVVGADPSAIRSLFGASRESGRRHHEGVDIHVQRLTPVLAVAPGRAMPRQDALGGNTVWLNTPGTSYYYAHLDRVAVRDGQRVKPGDVLGYVGNTGNASGTPSHLHFGVYRWGRDPIDPLPLIVGQRFDEKPATATLAGAGG